MELKKTRGEAIANGDKHYDTGKPCMYGHLSKRLTIDGSCLQCRAENQKASREAIRALMRERKANQ